MIMIGGYKMLKTPGLYVPSLFFICFSLSRLSLLYCFENVLLKQGNQKFLSCQIQAFDLPSPSAKVDHSFLKHRLRF